jgi:hypothetical protein
MQTLASPFPAVLSHLSPHPLPSTIHSPTLRFTHRFSFKKRWTTAMCVIIPFFRWSLAHTTSSLCSLKIMAEVLGTIVIALNGDRTEYYQDPETYVGSSTHSTPLGAVRLFLSVLSRALSFLLPHLSTLRPNPTCWAPLSAPRTSSPLPHPILRESPLRL